MRLLWGSAVPTRITTQGHPPFSSHYPTGVPATWEGNAPRSGSLPKDGVTACGQISGCEIIRQWGIIQS